MKRKSDHTNVVRIVEESTAQRAFGGFFAAFKEGKCSKTQLQSCLVAILPSTAPAPPH